MQICITLLNIDIIENDMILIKVDMSQEIETLADYVTRVMRDKDLSGYDVERLSNKGITQSYINRIKNGEVKNPSTPKQVALAKGLGVGIEEISSVIRGVSPDGAKIAHETLASIDFYYEGMKSKEKKDKADYVINLLKREIERINNEPD